VKRIHIFQSFRKARHMLYLLPVLVLMMGIMPVQLSAAPVEARDIVIDTTEQVLKILRQEKGSVDRERAFAIIDSIIVPHIDFARMAKLALGRYWRTANIGQRKKFVDEFRRLIIRTYATALMEYSDEKVEYLPLKSTKDPDEVVVQTIIKQSGGASIPVDYNMYFRSKEAWKLYDMSIDGISLVTNYRSSFATEIRKGGLDMLIEKMVEHNTRNGSGNANK
jgi:phospholipid transport system substrate-binding protein